MLTFAGCKINLGLSILGKRSDGYHNLETLLFPVPWNDIIEIVPSKAFKFSTSGLVINSRSADNLVVKALDIFKSAYKIPPVAIHLHKEIPFGAGLGGGSSDATATLLLLNKLFQIGANAHQLREMASKIGADCPFFVDNQPTLATGIGTDLTPFPIILSGFNLLIIKPEINISTSMAYGLVKSYTNAGVLASVLNQPVESWRGVLVNDFERSIGEQFPQIAQLIQFLYHSGASYAAMSGSGSAVFGLYKSKPDLDFKLSNHYRWFVL